MSCKFRIFLAAALLLTTSVAFANKVVDIFSFSDFHGQVLESANTNSPGIAKFVYAVKNITRKSSHYIIVSGGDNYVGQALSNINFGAPVNDMFRQLHVVASAVGNHEFDWGTSRMGEWARRGRFRFIAANILQKKDDKIPAWARPYIMVERDGVKIAVIGLATQQTPRTTITKSVEPYYVLDNAKALQYWINYLHDGKDSCGRPDAIIVLTHIPAWQDRFGEPIQGDELHSLLKKVRGIAGVFTGHSHRFVTGKIRGIPVIQAGSFGRALGGLKLTFSDGNKLLKATPRLYLFINKIAELKSNIRAKRMVAKYRKKASKELDKTIGMAAGDFLHGARPGHVTGLGYFVAKIMLNESGVQVALINGGSVRQDVLKGLITSAIIYGALPFDNHVVTLDLSGKHIKNILRHGVFNKYSGGVQFAGVKVVYDRSKPKGKRLVSVTWPNGKPLLDDKIYRVATLDFLIDGGDNYDFKAAKNVEESAVLIRDLVIQYIKDQKTITPEKVEVLKVVN